MLCRRSVCTTAAVSHTPKNLYFFCLFDQNTVIFECFTISSLGDARVDFKKIKTIVCAPWYKTATTSVVTDSPFILDFFKFARLFFIKIFTLYICACNPSFLSKSPSDYICLPPRRKKIVVSQCQVKRKKALKRNRNQVCTLSFSLCVTIINK